MSSFFSSDGSTTIQFAIIFAVIFAILAVAVFVFRRLTGRGQSLAAKVGGRGRQPRLGIIDIYELDRQRQLILLRRDNVEHLLLVGGPNDVVVERNIARGLGARLAEDEPARSEAEPAAPDPVRFPPPFEPAFEMPVPVPSPLPGSTARPDPVVRPLDPSTLDPAAPDLFAPDEIAPKPVRPPEPRPAVQDGPENPVPPVAAPATRPARRLSPSLANLVPSVINLVPGAAKRADPTGDESVDSPAAADPAPQGSSRPVDPAILSDMARQFEQVVRRPNTAVMPVRPVVAEGPPEPAVAPVVIPPAVPVVSAESAAAAPPPPRESDAVDPMAAAMAATAETLDRDDALFEPSAPEPDRPTPVTDRPIPAVRRPTPTPDATVPAPVAPQPDAPVADPRPTVAISEPKAAPDVALPPAEVAKSSPEVGKSSPDVTKPSPEVAKRPADVAKPPAEVVKPAAGPAGPSANPFSVEEIEAEFARLLGRSLDKKG